MAITMTDREKLWNKRERTMKLLDKYQEAVEAAEEKVNEYQVEIFEIEEEGVIQRIESDEENKGS